MPENSDEPNEIECCDKTLEWVQRQGDGSYVPKTADCPDCGAYFEMKLGNEIAYKSMNGGGSYNCTKCDSGIQSGIIAHPIHDGPFPLSGSGKCQNETVPYCPECEEKPNFHGEPIKVPSLV